MKTPDPLEAGKVKIPYVDTAHVRTPEEVRKLAVEYAPDPVHIQVTVDDYGRVLIQHDIANPTAGRPNEDGALRIAFADLPYLIALLQRHTDIGTSFGRYDIPRPANGDAFTPAEKHNDDSPVSDA